MLFVSVVWCNPLCRATWTAEIFPRLQCSQMGIVSRNWRKLSKTVLANYGRIFLSWAWFGKFFKMFCEMTIESTLWLKNCIAFGAGNLHISSAAVVTLTMSNVMVYCFSGENCRDHKQTPLFPGVSVLVVWIQLDYVASVWCHFSTWNINKLLVKSLTI